MVVQQLQLSSSIMLLLILSKLWNASCMLGKRPEDFLAMATGTAGEIWSPAVFSGIWLRACLVHRRHARCLKNLASWLCSIWHAPAGWSRPHNMALCLQLLATCKQRGIMLLLTLGNLWNAYKGPEDFLAMATGTAGESCC
jgi:hypothetical protein